jgi:hypothetical protein
MYHPSDAAIRDHMFCSFLALILQKELADLCQLPISSSNGLDLLRDLDRLQKPRTDRNIGIGRLHHLTSDTVRLGFAGSSTPPVVNLVCTDSPPMLQRGLGAGRHGIGAGVCRRVRLVGRAVPGCALARGRAPIILMRSPPRSGFATQAWRIRTVRRPACAYP